MKNASLGKIWLILVCCFVAQFCNAQHILYNETYLGIYVPSPLYYGLKVYAADSNGSQLRYDSLGITLNDDGDTSTVHWELVGSTVNSVNYEYFLIRYKEVNNHVHFKTIQVAKNIVGLFAPTNLWDSVYIFNTYDSSSGRFLYTRILTQVASSKKSKPINYSLKNYYYDADYNDTLELTSLWDSSAKKWVDSKKSVAVFRAGLGVPQYYQHYSYVNNAWLLNTVDSIAYDSAANPKLIRTQVNHNGQLVDSASRLIRRINANDVETYHFIYKNNQWIKDSMSITHYNYHGIASHLVKVYDPVSQLCIRAVKANYANPYYEDVEENESEGKLGIRLYPNPSLSSFNVEYNLPNSEDVDISLHDILGRQVRHIFMANQTDGNHIQQVDMMDLAPGIYMVRVQIHGKIKQEKIIKM